VTAVTQSTRKLRYHTPVLFQNKLRWLGVTSGELTWLVVALLFALSVAPTFISYQPYQFTWDDAEYFHRCMLVSWGFWHGNKDVLTVGLVSLRPPAMTMLGLPWGTLSSWNAAGKCFITLAAVISLLAALSLYLLLRIGVKPLFLVAASVCVTASLGPFPSGSSVHVAAAGFMADSLFAWTALAAVLLIPYEARMDCSSTRTAVLRGLMWALILSLGTMTKLSFLYFVVLIVPVLFFVRLHRNGSRSAQISLFAFACCFSPSVLYLIRWGQPAIDTAKGASSFGKSDYYIPLLQFLGNAVRESPGLLLSCALVAAALIYLAVKRPLTQSWPDLLALFIMIGFGIIVLASTNRQIRYSFPDIVALPFLACILMSGKGHPAPRRSAVLAACLVFSGLFAAGVPTRHRPNWQGLARCRQVLAVADRSNAKSIVLATDSPTLNDQLMVLARYFSESGVSNLGTLAYQAADNVPIEEDFRVISQYDLVVFQDPPALSPPFTNQRASEYERYAQQVGVGPIRVGDDISVYLVRRR
jgi:hypothetical protein